MSEGKYRDTMHLAGESFALAMEPVELVEVRRELVREVQLWLYKWERSRSAEARGRLLQSLDVLGMLIRGAGR